jgi:hypothetical protein
MREATDAMRSAANGLRREDPDEARANASRALDRLRELERSLEGSSPDGRRRALGDLQLEARQLADAERQLASEAERAQSGQGSQGNQDRSDTLRRLAGEQERLAERMRGIERSLREQAGSAPGRGGDQNEARALQQAAGEAAREAERQRLTERMQQSAESLRSGASGADPGSAGTTGGSSNATAPQEIARALDRLADRLASSNRSRDEASRALSAQLDRAQELRERLNDLTTQMEQLSRQSAAAGSDAGQAEAR